MEINCLRGQDVIVRDGDGVEWALAHWQVDAGREYLSRKFGWLPESDSRVVDYLKKNLEKLRGEKWDFAVESCRNACIKESEWVLRRDGLADDGTNQIVSVSFSLFVAEKEARFFSAGVSTTP